MMSEKRTQKFHADDVTTQGSDVICMKFLPLFLRRHLVAAARNVGCFLRL